MRDFLAKTLSNGWLLAAHAVVLASPLDMSDWLLPSVMLIAVSRWLILRRHEGDELGAVAARRAGRHLFASAAWLLALAFVGAYNTRVDIPQPGDPVIMGAIRRMLWPV